jgi:hypothetical protein
VDPSGFKWLLADPTLTAFSVKLVTREGLRCTALNTARDLNCWGRHHG